MDGGKGRSDGKPLHDQNRQPRYAVEKGDRLADIAPYLKHTSAHGPLQPCILFHKAVQGWRLEY